MSDKDQKIKLSTEPYKGVRDFYPADMALQSYMLGVMRKTVESFGYSEYGASVLEPSELYKAKSGDEIVNEQTYTFKDRGDREVTLRPEMTPTVARMVAAKRRELSFPLRWYSIPNLFRYEKPQRGRLREHWQLNVDLFGVKNIQAEVEIISVASSLVRNFGIKDSDFEIRINSRKLMNYIFQNHLGLNGEATQKLSRLIDRKAKMSGEDFRMEIDKILLKEDKRTESFLTLINSKNLEELVSHFGDRAPAEEAIGEIKSVMQKLEELGVTNVIFDQTLMRGFDYYTGIVFEVFDLNPENRRALFGGGRYDDLLDIFGAEKVPTVGFGMGDVTLRDVLETYKLLPDWKPITSLAICTFDDSVVDYANEIAQKLREQQVNVTVDYSGKRIGDQIKSADKQKVPFILCIGEDEVRSGKFKIKDLETGKETALEESQIADFLKMRSEK
jgi:histidyl-tRNA synthetase